MRSRRNKRGNLNRAERKVRDFHYGRQWVGYLTPCEILAILDDGARLPDNRDNREYYQKQKDAGFSGGHWFYFIPSKEQKERWS